MTNPVLKPNSSWFTPTVSTVTRAIITTINIVDSYTPSGTVTDSWDASVAQDGGIMCYVEGTDLTIAGNGSGKIMANADSASCFSDVNSTDYYSALTIVNGADILDTSNATTFFKMFNMCKKLTYVDVSTWNTSNVTTIRTMFQQCNVIDNLDVSGWDTSKVTEMRNTFYCNYALSSLDVSGWDVSKVTTMRNLFGDCSSLTELEVSNWDTSSCTSMQGMFSYCENLITMNPSNWNVSNVTEFNKMFQMCSVLEPFSVAKWNTSSATDMSFMFYKCLKFISLDFENWDVSNVTSFDHFLAHSTNLEDFDVSKWNITSACTNLYAAFHSTNAVSIDVTGWNTSNVIAFGQCFEGMSDLTEIKGLNTWDTSSGLDFAEIFGGCSNLKELDLSNFNTKSAKLGTSISGNGSKSACTQSMFSGCRSLEKITLGENFTLEGDGTAGSDYYGTLPTPSSTYIDDADGNWYTIDGTAYIVSAIPNLTAATYYASPAIVSNVIWDEESKKYMHLAAMRVYHSLNNAAIDAKIDTLREEIGSIEDITSEEVQALFSMSV